ncbi:MAG: hypothetical protein IKA02_00230 [Clostridia bacterium]|nr:hypothetical protein [Clostridia bacterium]
MFSELFKRNCFFLLNVSDSLTQEKKEFLKNNMVTCIEEYRKRSEEKESPTNFLTMTCDKEATWIIGNEEAGVDVNEIDYDWSNFKFNGEGNISGALEKCTNFIKKHLKQFTFMKPTVILITDGTCDDKETTDKAIEDFKAIFSRNGKDKVICVVVKIGEVENELLEKFAIKGTKCHESHIEENVPFIFDLDEEDLWEELANLQAFFSCDSFRIYDCGNNNSEAVFIGDDHRCAEDDDVIVIINDTTNNWDDL